MAAWDRVRAWEESLCKNPRVHMINGKPVTFLCMRERGHDGDCMEALVDPEDTDG